MRPIDRKYRKQLRLLYYIWTMLSEKISADFVFRLRNGSGFPFWDSLRWFSCFWKAVRIWIGIRWVTSICLCKSFGGLFRLVPLRQTPQQIFFPIQQFEFQRDNMCGLGWSRKIFFQRLLLISRTKLEHCCIRSYNHSEKGADTGWMWWKENIMEQCVLNSEHD